MKTALCYGKVEKQLVKIGWNETHQRKLTLEDKDFLLDTEIPKVLWGPPACPYKLHGIM